MPARTPAWRTGRADADAAAPRDATQGRNERRPGRRRTISIVVPKLDNSTAGTRLVRLVVFGASDAFAVTDGRNYATVPADHATLVFTGLVVEFLTNEKQTTMVGESLGVDVLSAIVGDESLGPVTGITTFKITWTGP